MPELPSVAICIPTYNQAQYLLESVGTAVAQTYPNVEVWVADNASTDNTPEVMAQLCQQFPQIRYHRHSENLGMTPNCNWVLSQPKTDYVIRLDSDDAIAPRYVETLVALMQKYPEAGWGHVATQEIDERGQKLAIRRVARKHEFQSADEALQASVSGLRTASSIFIFKAQALREVGFYGDGSLKYSEDYDLAVRMSDAGYGNVYSDDILAEYRVWTDTQKIRPKRKGDQLQAYIWIYNKSFIPAFQRRGWDTKAIDKCRQKMALIHAAACFSPIFTTAERAELIALLKELGDSPALRLRLFACSFGLGPMFDWQHHMKLKLKGMIKGWLSWLKNSSKVSAGVSP
ncbi:glycosyl transferase [Fischerella thermalis CCMEE 5198]|jgi:glycosyltransferase involved in cell wall biosynthesis|uniref:glycosyltransferase family 2 protein n=1 Tax=Fischerella thermalis TaxID=372787 RepID=UPI000C802CF6|nr:glycosyltransferase family 2 protein [Fischerella thermalis]PMB18100.1 glycosyl transferase [Fischerella thermalis CCMEE 5198]PMB52322.1 glycosyl transferase [Fischerella thermalis CCMEE 5201]